MAVAWGMPAPIPDVRRKLITPALACGARVHGGALADHAVLAGLFLARFMRNFVRWLRARSRVFGAINILELTRPLAQTLRWSKVQGLGQAISKASLTGTAISL
jgi:hypothetical protein